MEKRSRQPHRVAWTLERLVQERAIALGSAVSDSTFQTYSSALQSYLTFCKLHDFPIHPTLDTFSFFTVFMCHHIEPRSVGSYLSGICNQLEPYFPEVRKIRNSRLVSQTLAGCKRLRSKAIVRKQPLTTADLDLLVDTYHSSHIYDDILFLAMILQGFVTLIRLGEMTWPDNPSLQSWRRVPMRTSLHITTTHISYVLPGHKADRFYEGSKLLDGATALAQAGVPDDRIQAVGRWSSEAFKAYLRNNPIVMQSLIWGRPVLDDLSD
ncbi:hypothetical protein BD410DRAFT_880461 [Rickenella mellea]|uniref:Core-binding (CB) domain-containing protein n=1 Tax=Rickenella mellea TaxID=50990 RepID=A0A4Y7PTQ6_9AGAM|nr:hypothetical protein BD410DRAFT_880461 [Rickenella mellea]